MHTLTRADFIKLEVDLERHGIDGFTGMTEEEYMALSDDELLELNSDSTLPVAIDELEHQKSIGPVKDVTDKRIMRRSR